MSGLLCCRRAVPWGTQVGYAEADRASLVRGMGVPLRKTNTSCLRSPSLSSWHHQAHDAKDDCRPACCPLGENNVRGARVHTHQSKGAWGVGVKQFGCPQCAGAGDPILSPRFLASCTAHMFTKQGPVPAHGGFQHPGKSAHCIRRGSVRPGQACRLSHQTSAHAVPYCFDRDCVGRLQSRVVHTFVTWATAAQLARQ